MKGNDTLTSGGKSDVLLVGGSGDDSLIMSGGNGTLSDGAGKDTFELTYSATKRLSAIIEDLDPASDKIIVNYDGETPPQLSSSVSGSDVVLRDGERLSVTLKSVRDNDYFDGDASNNAWKVLELTNAEREKKNLPALTMAEGLTAGASIRVDEITDLGQDGVLNNHMRPDGTDFSTVLDGKYNFPGENLAGGSRTPAQVVQEWMNSDAHKENILRERFQKLGVGYNEYDADPSDLRFYWTQLFADSLKAQETVDVSTARPQVNTVSKFIALADGGTYRNSEYGATIQAQGGGTSITNTGLIVSISGSDDNDTITNGGSFSTISAGKGDDSISLGAATKENVIEYATGDGNDTISGLNSSDTLSISANEFSYAVSGKDVILTIGTGSIKFVNAANISSININDAQNKFVILNESDNTYDNFVESAIIRALGGDDYIVNFVPKALIYGDNGDDYIDNTGATTPVTVDGGAGNDTLHGGWGNASIVGGTGNDYISSGGISNIIDGGDGKDTIYNGGDSAIIDAGSGNDLISNGNSFLKFDQDLQPNYAKIIGSAGNDLIENFGHDVTINGGRDNDSISLLSGAQNNLIEYTTGDGKDIVSGFNEDDTLRIGGGTGTYSTQTVGDDVIVNVGKGSVRLLHATSLSAVNIDGVKSESSLENNFIYIPESLDAYSNTLDGVTIAAFSGDKSITNTSSNVRIHVGTGKNTINTESNNVTVIGGNGNDKIDTKGDNVTIDAEDGDDSITGDGDDVTITGGKGDDQISLSGRSQGNLIYYTAGDGNDIISGFKLNDTLSIAEDNFSRTTVDNDIVVKIGEGSVTLLDAATLSAVNITDTHILLSDDNVFVPNEEYVRTILTEGNDRCYNNFEGVTIVALGGYDSIENWGNSVLINGGADGDYIRNWSDENGINADTGNDVIQNYGDSVIINGGAGNDSINSLGRIVSINGGSGNDTISSHGDNNDLVTILGGGGDDYIDSGYDVGFISYFDSGSIDGGDGNDTINSRSGSNVSITGGKGNDKISLSSYSKNTFIRYTPGDGNDTIWGLTENSTLQIGDGTGTYSTVVSGDDIIVTVGYGSIRLVNFRANPEHIIIGESGTSGGSSGGQSGGGGGGSSSGGSGGSSGGGGGNTLISRTASARMYGNNTTSTAAAEVLKRYNEMLSQIGQPQQPSLPSAAQHVYTGGNQVISNYQSGDKIIFSGQYTGAFYDGAGNFIAGSSTGALAIQNALDKVIDLSDAAGNDFVKAYAATTAGLIDGRGISGFELINGSAGSDTIYAGNGGSQLWGGCDNVTDILVGGGGTDIFIGGRTQGADVFLNTSSADVIHLNDATLGDIIATAEDNGVVAVAFNTGNVIAAQSTELLSSAFVLSDGSAYRYNHAAKTWQTA